MEKQEGYSFFFYLFHALDSGARICYNEGNKGGKAAGNGGSFYV
jgi:hypothetical protein